MAAKCNEHNEVRPPKADTDKRTAEKESEFPIE